MLKDCISTGFDRAFGRGMRLLVAITAISALSACVAEFRNHGYIPSNEALEQIVVGESTKATVESVIGKPQAEGLLETSGWYFVRSQFRHYGAFEPREIERQVLAISFNAAGVVSNVERFGLEDGQVITLSRRVIQSNTQGITFASQLLGSFGNISAEQLLN